MNKLFVAVALVAVLGAVCAVAEVDDEMTQMALFQDDEGETKGLSADHQIFRQFCLDTRDKVKSYLKQIVNEKASSTFKLVVELFSESVSAVGSKSSSAVTDGTAVLQSDARALANVLKAIANVIYDSTKSEALDAVQQIRRGINGETAIEHIQNACRDVTMNLKRDIEEDFRKTQRELSRADPNKQFKAVIADAKLNKLGCVTTSRVVFVANSCGFIGAILPSLRDYFSS